MAPRQHGGWTDPADRRGLRQRPTRTGPSHDGRTRGYGRNDDRNPHVHHVADDRDDRGGAVLGLADTDATTTGTVTYRERIALTPGATLTVQLRDTSLMDVSRRSSSPSRSSSIRARSRSAPAPLPPERHRPSQHLLGIGPDRGVRRPASLHQRHRLRRDHPRESQPGGLGVGAGRAPAGDGGRRNVTINGEPGLMFTAP